MLSRLTTKFSPILRSGLNSFAVKCSTSLINKSSRCFGSTAFQELERKFSKVLEEEISQENSSFAENPIPEGFSISREDGHLIEISKTYSDGCIVSVEINLAGSVSPDMESEGQTKDNVTVRPDIDIKLKKPNSKSIIFHCVFPEQQQDGDESSCMIIESVELESIPGYFIYADVFDDNMYDHVMGLLTERGLDENFQEELQAFCSSKEHSTYIRFLNDMKLFCEN